MKQRQKKDKSTDLLKFLTIAAVTILCMGAAFGIYSLVSNHTRDSRARMGEYTVSLGTRSGNKFYSEYLLLIRFPNAQSPDEEKSVKSANVSTDQAGDVLSVSFKPVLGKTREDCGPTGLCLPNNMIDEALDINNLIPSDTSGGTAKIAVTADGQTKEFKLTRSGYTLTLTDSAGRQVGESLQYFPSDVTSVSYSSPTDARRCKPGTLSQASVLGIIKKSGYALAETKYPGITASKPDRVLIINNGTLSYGGSIGYDSASDCRLYVYVP